MKRLFPLALLFVMLLSGCAVSTPETASLKQYSASFLDVFDTVTTIVGRAENEEDFRLTAQQVHDDLEHYHRLFDIYNEYEGMANLCTVNKNAGIAPVKVDAEIIELLLDCREYFTVSGGMVNTAMGSVLSLWHDARSYGANDPVNAYLPDESALRLAKEHTSFDLIVIDEEAQTVFITDPDASLDVGAIAKGWSAQKAAEHAPEGLLISVGGNVCATGPKDASGTPWVIGVQDPDGRSDEYLHTVYLTKGCVVTSGDYQRTYMVDGKSYHHIIDPDTLYPAARWRAVTVVCDHSGVADMLSTALFLLPQEDGQKLLDLYGAKALWVPYEGELLYSPGFSDLIRT